MAFADNMKEVATGVYALYVGDVNQDEVIDLSDLVDMDTDLTNGTVAYVVYDLNGDGVVDLSDLVAIDENLTNGVVSMYP
jgi:Ca2+-binding EF-hand superfamily protein